MFKMDSRLTQTMEEFQEMVRAQGEESHWHLLDTAQMLVARKGLWSVHEYLSIFILYLSLLF